MSSVLSVALVLSSLLLALGAFLAFLRLLRGPGLPDRVIALDLMTTLTVAAITVYAIATRQRALLDSTLVVALVAFLGTVTYARYLERRARHE